MNKTMTRLLLWSILVMCNCLYGQQQAHLPIEKKAQAPGYATLICPNGSNQAFATITIPPGYTINSDYYFLNDSGDWPCFFCGQRPTTLTFQIPRTGKTFSVKVECLEDLDGDGIYQTEELGWSFYSPVDLSISATASAITTCNAQDGSIQVQDNSSNPSGIPRLYILYNSQDQVVSQKQEYSNTYTFNNLGTGTYKVRVSNYCSYSETTKTVAGAALNANIDGPTVLCQGSGAQLSVVGGSTFAWQHGPTSRTIVVSPSTVGTHHYQVTVSDGICSKVIPHQIQVNAAPSAQINGPSSVCYNGSVTLSGSGTGTYAWSTGSTTSSISPSLLQSTQTYRLTVTDPSTQCSSVDEHEVRVLPRPSLNEAPNSICAGESVSLSVSGGSTYSWNVGGTTASIAHSPSSSTEYRVTVTDANGCSYVLSKSISVSNPPNITFGGGTSICAGQSLNITAFGGSSYSWNYNSANTATITVSPTTNTTYTVTATSSGGCVASAERVITVKPSPTGNIDAPSSICPGQSVILIASGGSSYAWNGGASTASITVSPTQNTNYTVSISNTEGCTVVKSHAIAVNISGSASNDGPLTCSKTSVMLRATTGAAGASFSWRNVQGAEIATTATTTVSMPGVYNLEITGAGGCKVNAATEVVQNVQVPEVNANSSGMLTCVQSSVNLSGSSSVSPASYEWRNGSGTLIANTLNTSVTQAGTYTLKVSAANGCSSTASATVTADLTSPQVNVQHDGALTCTKTNAILSASSSTPGLQYTWKNAAGNTLGTGSSIQVNTSGTYWLEARGSNACMFSQSITLTQSGSLPTVNVSKSTSGCNFTLQGSSTTPGVTYAWSNQNGRVVATTPNFTTNQEGTYTLKVSTATGCSQQASINAFAYGTTVSISIDGASQGYLTYHKTNLTCTKNSVVLSANSSDAIESYFWVSPSGTPLGYNPSLTATQTGTYLLIAGTENGCPQTHEVLVERINTMPAVQITGDSTVCRYTSTTLSAYLFGADSYQWSNGSTSSTINTGSVSSDVIFEVTVTMGSCQRMLRRTVRVEGQAPGGSTAGPTKPCTHIPVTYSAAGGSAYKWSSGETTATISVPNGFTNTNWVGYWVDISDQYGCTTRRSFTVKPTGSPVVTVSGIPTAPFCAQASINLTASAGGAWGNYLWSTGETTTNLQKTLHESTALNLKFTASNGCVVTKSINVEVVPRPSPQILGGDIACAGDNTTLTATGGTSYLWNTNATTSSISINQPTQSQTYTVTASSMPGCTGVASKVVTVPAPLSLSYTLAGNDDCIPNNVTVIPTVSGGTGSIELSLAEVGTNDFRPVLNGLRSGNYVLKAKDSKGCEVTRAVSIDEAQELTLLANFGDERQICKGTSIELEAFEMHSGGTAPFTYSWNTGSSAASIEAGPISDTNYSVSISDSKGCSKVAEILVMVLPAPEVEIQGAEAVCPGTVVVLESEVNGGISPFTYRWNTGASTEEIQISLTQNSTFTLTLTDAKGCEYIQSKTITLLPAPSPSDLTLSSQTQNHLSCAQPNANIQVSSPLSNLSYTWKNNAGLELSTGSNLVVNEAGTYWVEARNSSGCTASKSITITQDEALPTLYLNTFPKVLNCDEGSIWVSGRSTTPGVRFEWRNAEGQLISTQAGFEAHYPGTFTLKAISTEGCANSIMTQIEDDIYLNFDVIIDDQNEGQSKSFFSRTITCTKPKVKIDLGPLLVVSSGVENQKQNSIKLIDPEGNIQEINRLESIMLTQGGTYRIVWAVFDDECKRSKEIFVKDEREEILAEIEGETTICPGGTTTLSATGGNQFLWSTGATTSSIEVQVSQNSTYTVTVSKGSCSGEAEVEVLVHNPILLEHQLTGTDDCTPNNAVLIPSSSGGTGNIVWSLAKAGSTDFSSILNGLGSGDYVLKAKDANGCEVEKTLSIKETPATISELKLSGLNDCTPGNTQMEIVTTGDRLPLIYRLNGTVLSGKTTILPRTAGAYTIEVEDAAGCVASKEDYFDDYDALQVLDNNITHVSDCSTPNGAIHMTPILRAGDFRDYNLSVDGGTTWHNATNLVLNLPPGKYPTSARSNLHGCIMTGPEVQINAPDCLPEAGFTQSVLHITSPTQRIALPWRVDKRPWGNADQPFSLHIYRVGDGKPHFVDPNIATATEPLEKSLAEGSAGFTIEYAVDFEGSDERELLLQPEAGKYLEPGVYKFKMESVDGVNIIPERNTLVLFVILGPESNTKIETITACPGEQITLEGEPGMDCYYWEGLGDITKDILVKHQPGTIYRLQMLKDNVLKTKIFYGDGEISPFSITSSTGKYFLCAGQGQSITLNVKKTSSNNQSWKFVWDDTDTEDYARIVKPEGPTTYSGQAINLSTGCTFPLSVQIEVREAIKAPEILPKNRIACGNTPISVVKRPNESYEWTYLVETTGFKFTTSSIAYQDGMRNLQLKVNSNYGCSAQFPVEIGKPSLASLANIPQRADFFFFPGAVKLSQEKVESRPEIGQGPEVEMLGREKEVSFIPSFQNHTFNEIQDLALGIGSFLPSDHIINRASDRKVFIITPDAFCKAEEDIIAKAIEEAKKHELGYVVLAAQGGLYILSSTFKKDIGPVSGDHRSFINTRLSCILSKDDNLTATNALQVVFNSLVNNYVESYASLLEGFENGGCTVIPTPSIVAGLELTTTKPCRTLGELTYFFSPAGHLVDLGESATARFSIKTELEPLAPKGCLTAFTLEGNVYTGRYWPPAQPMGNNDFIGYDNETETPRNYRDVYVGFEIIQANKTRLVNFALNSVSEYYGKQANGYRLVQQYYITKIENNSRGKGPFVADVITADMGDFEGREGEKPGPYTIPIHRERAFFSTDPPPVSADDLRGWNVRLDIPDPRRGVVFDLNGKAYYVEDPNYPGYRGGFEVYIPMVGTVIGTKDDPIITGYTRVYIEIRNGDISDVSRWLVFDPGECVWKPITDVTFDEFRSALSQLPLDRFYAMLEWLWSKKNDIASAVLWPIGCANFIWAIAENTSTQDKVIYGIDCIGGAAVTFLGKVTVKAVGRVMLLEVEEGINLEKIVIFTTRPDGKIIAEEVNISNLINQLRYGVPDSGGGLLTNVELQALLDQILTPDFLYTKGYLLKAVEANPRLFAETIVKLNRLGVPLQYATNLELLAKMTTWSDDLIEEFGRAVTSASNPGLGDAFLKYPLLVDEFVKLNSDPFYRYFLKHQQLTGNRVLVGEFGRYFDGMPSGLSGKILSDYKTTLVLGNGFDDYCTGLVRSGRTSEITGLNAELFRITGSSDWHFQPKLELYFTKSSYATPDVVAFKIDPATRQAIKTEAYWVEFKVVETTTYSPQQKILFNDHIGNGSQLRIRSKNPSTVHGLNKDDIVELRGVIQVSASENGLRVWQVK